MVADRAVAVAVDGGSERIASPAGFVVYVAPGKAHTVGFEPSTPRASLVRVTVAAGELVEVSAPPPAEPAPASDASPAPPRSERLTLPSSPPASQASPTRHERPFPAAVLYASGALASAALIVPVIAFTSAKRAASNYDDAMERANASRAASDPSSYAIAASDGSRYASDYDSARTVTYISTAAAGALGAVTVGLLAYWLWGTKPEASGAVRF